MHAAMSSPLATVFMAAISAMGPRNEFSLLLEPGQREDVLQGILRNFYGRKTDVRTVFDTNRAWCSKLGALAQLLPESRVICCVRNVAWIIDSIERLVQANPLEEPKLFPGAPGPHSPMPGGTVYSRAEQLMDKGGMVRVALDSLREAFYGPNADRIILVRYESLTREPASTITAIYEFLGEQPFAHDFEAIEYSEERYDRQMGLPGLHTLRRSVQFHEREMIIPPDLVARFNIEFWNDARSNHRKTRII